MVKDLDQNESILAIKEIKRLGLDQSAMDQV